MDIETTGGSARTDKITEIGIVIHDGQQIIETYESLINPQVYIPIPIVQLTGITQEMVSTAPLFHELARKIVEITEGAIFVAHNVRFDYGFLRQEFARLGYTYTRKQLCTVRMSRKAFPGLASYSLENLIRHFDIKTEHRHRALADALATTDILERILAQESNQDQLSLMINMGIKESKLPNGISLDRIHDLPEACGVYYFYNANKEVVYVGKSINIKKRIADHFADQTDKGRRLQRHVADISFELTGSELIALLLESQEIKRLKPSINRAQRRKVFPFAIHSYKNDEGYICFDVVKNNAKTKEKYNIISEYPSMSSAKGRLNAVMSEYELCGRFCHITSSKSACFYYHLKQCKGACTGIEAAVDYNERAEAAKVKICTVFDEDFFLIDIGRNQEEHSVVLVEKGHFVGFGYIDLNADLDLQALRMAIKVYPSYPDTARIIQRFMVDHANIRKLKL